MNKKIKVGLITCCSLLLLTGCSPVSHKTQHQEKKIAVVKKHSSKKIVNEDGVRLSTKLTPKEIASAITVCAANKYHGTWVKVLNEARTNGLKISFHNRSDYPKITNGQGYVYGVSADKQNSGACYTLNDDQIFIYDNQTELGSITVDKMVKYLNTHNSAGIVKRLANDVVLGTADNNSNGSSTTKIAGDRGLDNAPAEMLGTWYSYDNHEEATVTFTEHTIEETEDGRTVTTELHKMNPDRDRGDHDQDKAYWAKTKHWATISKFKVPESKPKDNKLYYNIYGWNETAGDGEFYALHTEESQPVLILAGGAGIWTDAVYWKTPELAQKYAGKKFHDLRYREMD